MTQELFTVYRPSDGAGSSLRIAALLVAALIALGISGYLWSSLQPDPARPLWPILAIGGIVAVLTYRFVAGRIALLNLDRCIASAQVGKLRTASAPRGTDHVLRRVLGHYNQLVTNLDDTLQEIEQCQNHVIAERNRNEAILQSLPGALLCIDSDWCVTLSNLQAEQLFKRSDESLVGTNLFTLLELDTDCCDMLRDAFLYDTPVSNRECSIRISEEIRYFTLNVSFYRQTNSSSSGAVLTLQDITTYKQLQESTYTNEKLSAMGQLAAGVAHELNTPLGNIIGYTRLISEPGVTSNKLREYTGIVDNEARRCSRIVDDLLRYARRDPCADDSCDVNATIEDVAGMLRNCQGGRFACHLDFTLARERLVARGNESQLDTILVNLLMNAFHATRDLGEAACVNVTSAKSTDGYAEILVEDNGPGVPPQSRRRIFDPFFTTNEVGQGTGLGLAISQAIATRLGGKLRYESVPGRGARFVLALPLASRSND